MIDVLLWLAVIAVAYLGVRLWQVSRPKPPDPRPPTQEERDYFIVTHPHPPPRPPEKLLP